MRFIAVIDLSETRNLGLE